MGEERRNHYEEILPTVAEKTSEAERRADESERETLKLKKAEYMEDHIGEEFGGVISGITNWGIYVELPKHRGRPDPCIPSLRRPLLL